MRLKLSAIWLILKSEHFFLLSGAGSVRATYPEKAKSVVGDLARAYLESNPQVRPLEDEAGKV